MSPKYIGYIPTPRAGSTSIRHALTGAGLLDTDFRWDVPSQKGFFITRMNRSAVDFFVSRWWEKDSDVEMFTVVRNPYDRLVSGWLHTNKQGWLSSQLTLEEYCELLGALYTCRYPGEHCKWINDDPEMISTAGKHAMNWESLVHTAINAGKVNKRLWRDWFEATFNDGVPPSPILWPKCTRKLTVLKFEQIRSDFSEFCDRLGYPGVHLPWKHKTEGRKHFSEYHTPMTIDFVREYYRYELEAFGYE